jgi:hypothetical protein
MQNIQASINLLHYDSGAAVSGGSRRKAHETSFSISALSVNTTPEAVPIGDIITPRSVAVKCYGGDDAFVSLDGGATFPFRLSPDNDSMLLRLDFEAHREVSTFVCEADTAGSLSGEYIQLYDRNGKVWPWFNITGLDPASVPPSVTTERLIRVDIPSGATATQVAVALAAALNADTEFSAPVPTTATAVITDQHAGARTAASAGNTGWASVTAGGQGLAFFDVQVKSAGVSQVAVAVSPN